MEPECQSLGLHQHPNQNTRTLEPNCHLMDLHRLPSTQQAQSNTIRIRTANRWAYIHILTHKKITSKHTQKEKKSARRDLARSPAYIPRLERGSGRCSSPKRERNSSQKPRETHYQGAVLEPSVIMHHCPMLWFLPTCTTAS